jgi:metal-dependent HD superfamily phosphatase/phosphodiesterase
MSDCSPSSVTLENVQTDEVVGAYVAKADRSLEDMGFTEHGTRHCRLTAKTAARVLRELEHPPRETELAAIAGYLHDIGNAVNRLDHAMTGALLAHHILYRMGLPPEELAEVVSAIGNHDEESSEPMSPVAAAVVLGDKSDVHRSRVRKPHTISFDIHDRVNYAVRSSKLNVNAGEKSITLEITIDTQLSQVMEYFEIFLGRMLLCKRAAEVLGCVFHLIVNETRLH